MLRFSKFAFAHATKKSKPEYLYGLNPVLACLSANRRTPSTLYLNIAEKGERKSSDKMQQIQRMSSSQKIKTKYLVKGKLLKFTGQRPCQNVVLKVDKLAYNEIRSIKDVVDLEAKPQGKGRLILFLD